jgi:hypothetical protein
MPEVFRERGFRFFFYANEGDPVSHWSLIENME